MFCRVLFTRTGAHFAGKRSNPVSPPRGGFGKPAAWPHPEAPFPIRNFAAAFGKCRRQYWRKRWSTLSRRYRDRQIRCLDRTRRRCCRFGCEKNRAAWRDPMHEGRSRPVNPKDRQEYWTAVDSRIRDRSIRESTEWMPVASPQRAACMRTHSLSVIRIRPSPVTTRPLAVIAT